MLTEEIREVLSKHLDGKSYEEKLYIINLVRIVLRSVERRVIGGPHT